MTQEQEDEQEYYQWQLETSWANQRRKFDIHNQEVVECKKK